MIWWWYMYRRTRSWNYLKSLYNIFIRDILSLSPYVTYRLNGSVYICVDLDMSWIHFMACLSFVCGLPLRVIQSLYIMNPCPYNVQPDTLQKNSEVISPELHTWNGKYKKNILTLLGLLKLLMPGFFQHELKRELIFFAFHSSLSLILNFYFSYSFAYIKFSFHESGNMYFLIYKNFNARLKIKKKFL